MKIKRIFSAILVALMIMTLFTACAEQDDTPDGYQLVVRDGDKFRLYVPTQGWSPNTAGGVTGAFFSLEQNASVNVYLLDDAGEMSVDEYWEHCNSVFEKELKEYSFAGKSENCVLGGQPAKKYLYSAKITVTDNGTDTEKNFKFLTVLCRYESEMYMLVYSAPEEYYDTHIEDVEGDADGAGIIPYFKFAAPYVSEKKEYSDKVQVPEGMKLISTDELAYRFFIPNDWTVNNGAEFSAAKASDGSSNVSVQMYMTDDDNETVDDYFSKLEKKYKEVFSSYKLDSTESIKMDGSDAKKYTYTIVVGGIEYKQMQAIVVRGAVFYTLTYTALPENFDLHIGDVEKMIEVFDIR